MPKYSLYILLCVLSVWQTPIAQTTNKEQLALSAAKNHENRGEYTKALRMYEQLCKAAPQGKAYKAYFSLAMRTQAYARIARFLAARLKEKEGMRLRVDLLYVWKQAGHLAKVKENLHRITQRVKNKSSQLKDFAYHLSRRELYEEAIQAYRAGNKAAKDPFLYTFSIIQLYFNMGNREQGLNESLLSLQAHPDHLSYVKNIINVAYTTQDKLAMPQNILRAHRQKNPDNISLLKLSVWLQSKLDNYAEAFHMALVADKRTPLGKRYFMNLGEKAQKAAAYTAAIQIFTHFIAAYPLSAEVRQARYLNLQAREKLCLQQVPILRTSLQKLVHAYTDFLAEDLRDEKEIEARERLAWLYMKHLQAPDSAIALLQVNLTRSAAYPALYFRNKSYLGDAYLLHEQPWEGILCYIQVEKEAKTAPMREKARFSRAKASYYQGAFLLAKAQFDALKQSTFKYTANDALFFSTRIATYLPFPGYDSVAVRPLQDVARAELLMEAGKMDTAIHLLKRVMRRFPKHSGIEYTQYFLAEATYKVGNFDDALALLDRLLLDDFGLFADKVLMLQGKILEEKNQDYAAAIIPYQQLIQRFPESIYVPQIRRHLQKISLATSP